MSQLGPALRTKWVLGVPKQEDAVRLVREAGGPQAAQGEWDATKRWDAAGRLGQREEGGLKDSSARFIPW